jgi:hypothetical protein
MILVRSFSIRSRSHSPAQTVGASRIIRDVLQHQLCHFQQKKPTQPLSKLFIFVYSFSSGKYLPYSYFLFCRHFRDSTCSDLLAYVADLNQQCVPSGTGSYYANYPAYTTYNNTNCAGKGTTAAQYFSDQCTSVAPLFPGGSTNYDSSDLIILASYDDDATSNNLNGGAIAGIVIGVIAGVVLIGALVYLLTSKKSPLSAKQHSDSQSDYNAF